MKRLPVLLLLLVALVVLMLPVTASGQYDRKPVRLQGMVPDEWGLSLSRGANKIRRDLYPNAYTAYCVGVIMVGFAEESSFLHGGTRYWDKLYCSVVQRKGAPTGVGFVLDAKRTRTIVYRKTTFTN